MDSPTILETDYAAENTVEAERMNRYEYAAAEVLPEWEHPDDKEKAPGKGQLTARHHISDDQILPNPKTAVNSHGEPFQLVRANQIREPSETADFVEGLLTEGGASVIYGPSNTGKSFWVLELAAAVAMGSPLHGRMETDRGAVVYCALEGEHGVRNRITAIKQAGKLNEEAPLYLCFAQISLLEKGNVSSLTASVKQAAKDAGIPCRLVIIDTLARAMPGGNENECKDMGNLISAMDQIRAKTGAHVTLVHHSGKNQDNGARGHSSLRAAVDTEIKVTRTVGGVISSVHVTKQRDLPIMEPIAFSLAEIDLGANRRGKPITSCIVIPECATHASIAHGPGRKLKYTKEQLLELLPVGSVKEWEKAAEAKFGVKRTQFNELKKQLVKDEMVSQDKETKEWIATYNHLHV
jgi:hypothetical protein